MILPLTHSLQAQSLLDLEVGMNSRIDSCVVLDEDDDVIFDNDDVML